jgi:polygalacturonase
MRRVILTKLILGVTALLVGLSRPDAMAQTYNIKDFGAVADGKTINTKAIQAAIDKCAQTGGQVIIPEGTFVSGTLQLKSKVHMLIKEGGVLKGSPYFKDYPDNPVQYQNSFTYSVDGKPHANKAFLFAEGVDDISITGKGTINGSGDSPEFNLGNDDTPASRLRPCMLLIVNSKHISVQNLTLTNSAYWLQNYLGCEYLTLKDLTIYNQSNYNQDAMDIDARHVLITGCKIDADDDGICLKSHSKNFVVEDVTVRNCTIASNCNAIKFGTASKGGFKNINISNCTIQKASADHIRQWQKNLQFIGQPVTVISGIAIESVDGGVIDRVNISDIKMRDVQTPIFIVLGNRGNKQAGDKSFYSTGTGKVNIQNAGSIRNIIIKNIEAISYSKMSSSITAFPGVYVENISLTDVNLNSMGNGTLTEANTPLIENPAAYPENRMYGQVYPSSGFFIRHVRNISLNNVKFTLRNADYRPCVILDDVLKADIKQVNLPITAGKMAAIKIISSKSIAINHAKINSIKMPLVQLSGTAISQLKVTGFKKYKGWLIE